jgi:ribosome-binding protein aMBF1 (putative translation factor)
MLAHTKKHLTEKPHEARFIGEPEKIVELRRIAKKMGLHDATDSVTVEEAFPEYAVNPLGSALRGARHREGLTQRQLAEKTGIPQRHISEMESGKRQIGRERAKRLAETLNVADYRVFL